MYNRRGNQQLNVPRGLQLNRGGGRGGTGLHDVPLFQQRLQLAGRQGVHGGTMLGMHSGINPTLNPANRGPPGISATAMRAASVNFNHSGSARMLRPQQLLHNQNFMASAVGRLIANQIQQKQQLQQLQVQQHHQNIQQNQLQQHQHRSGISHNIVPTNDILNTPRFPTNNPGMSQSVPNQRLSVRPPVQSPLSRQLFESPVLRAGPFVNNQRPTNNARNLDSGQETHTKEWERNLPRDRDSRFSTKDRDSKADMWEEKCLRKASFDREKSRKCSSPERRTSHSYDGSNASDTLSNRTDTGSNSRSTPVSRTSGGHRERKSQKSCAERVRNHRSITSRSRQSDSKAREFRARSSSRDKVRDDESNGLKSQRIVSSSSKKRQKEEANHAKSESGDIVSNSDKGRVNSKRHHEDSRDGEDDEKLDDRDWRSLKRLRPDSREPKAKPEKDEAVADPVLKDSTPSWIRCSPADLYFTRNAEGFVYGTQKMKELEELFEEEIVNRAQKVRSSMPDIVLPPPPPPVPCVHHHHHHHHHGSDSCSSSGDSSSSDSDSDSDEDGEMCSKWVEEMERKRMHPSRLHPELWGNDPGEMNNGPLCRCSIKSRRSGIRHDIYPGEKLVEQCDPSSNNLNHLYHYRITMSPSTNFLTNSPSVIEFDSHEFIFEGFSLFTHEKLENVPLCKVIRFHIEYSIHCLEEPAPENFTIRSLDVFSQFLFSEILELVDLDWKGFGGGCNRFHLLPRFARSLPENGKEILSLNEVLKYLLQSSRPLVDESELPEIRQMDKEAWQSWVDKVCGMIVTYPGKKPSSIRVDQLDRTKLQGGEDTPPILVHFGIRPAQLSYAGNPAYQKAWKQYIKFKHLLNSKPKVLSEDKEKLKAKEALLQDIQAKSTMKREVTVELSTQGFSRTGLKSDICQHALLLPVLMSHIRFHNCLTVLEQHMNYVFKDRTLLQLALTHTSFRTNYGTNSAHARNSLTNCGLRQVEYGDRRVYYQNTRKRGINILVDIMSRLGRKEETMSEIPHNERLEFLGDAVVEFLSSVHLFFMFPWLEEGGLSTYRTAIVQNQHLSVLAKNLRLQDFMLYVHGPDLCHESDLRHAMANCFEALMGALFLDGGLETVDDIFGRTLFEEDMICLKMWQNLPLHPLQEDEPGGDRHWVESSPALQKLIAFEESTGLSFNHIRLLAKAFTHRNVGYNLLTMGHNQRLEFLGDTVLQLIASEYLYKHFPEHHEGHLSLLRSSLVNSRTQSIVCDDLGMTDYVIYSFVGSDKDTDSLDMKTKQKADLLEAFLGALYVDSGIGFCRTFCNVCFFPRLKDFIENQDWNDPKSQLQQCCLTLRKMGGGEPDIPFYNYHCCANTAALQHCEKRAKVIESLGPSNTRKYVVAVYFRGERLATGSGHSIQQAEMSAANNALKIRSELFPILQHQRRFLDRYYKEEERSSKPRQYRTQSRSVSRKPSASRAEGRSSNPRRPTVSPKSSTSRCSRSSSGSSVGSNRSRHHSNSRKRKSIPSRSETRPSATCNTSKGSTSSSYTSNSSCSNDVKVVASGSSLPTMSHSSTGCPKPDL